MFISSLTLPLTTLALHTSSMSAIAFLTIFLSLNFPTKSTSFKIEFPSFRSTLTEAVPVIMLFFHFISSFLNYILIISEDLFNVNTFKVICLNLLR